MKKALLGLAALTLVAAFFIGEQAHADIISSYTTDNTVVSESASGIGYIVLGTGLTGTPSYFQFYASSTGGTTDSFGGSTLNACKNSDYTNCYTYATQPSSNTVQPVKGLITVFISATTSLNSTYYYYWSNGSSAGSRIYGTTADPFPAAGRYCRNFIGAGSDCTFTDSGTIRGAWFVLGGNELVPLQSQVYAIDTPTEFQITSSTNVPVSFDYLNGTGYDKVGIEVMDLSNSLLSLRTGEVSANTNGTYTYSNVLSLSSNRGYRIRGYLRQSTASTSILVYGPYRTFSTNSDQFFNSTSTFVNITQINESNASSSIQSSLSGFTNIAAFLADRVPFGYLWDIRDIYANAATSSSQFSGLTWDFSNSGLSTTAKSFLPASIAVFSTTTITYYFPSAVLDSFNALASAALYIALMYYIFQRVKGITATGI